MVNIIPEVEIFQHYKSLNACLLNNKSILLSESLSGTHLDIFDKENNFIYFENKKNNTLF